MPLIGEDPQDVIDLGEAPTPTPSPTTTPTTQPEPSPSPQPPPEPTPTPSPDDDLGPAHATRDWHKAGKPPRGKPPRITATIRTDINAKISMPLEIFGHIWGSRDPYCGGTFIKQRPQIADALTDIVCQSADLVQFFTGTGGGFMLYLQLGAALWPVVEVGFAHHVYHTIGEETENPHEPAQRYAA